MERQEGGQRNSEGGGNGVLLWGGVILAVVAGIAAMIYVAKQKPVETVKPLANKISDSDWVYGNRNAKVTLIEYSDFQCPACGAYYPIVKKIKDDYAKDIAFAYRHFPIPQLHKNAKAAAYAAEAAGRQGKFWEMHDMLFEHQKEWGELDNPQDSFIGYATALSLDIAKFGVDAGSEDVKRKVDRDSASGVASGVNATPSFFLNEQKIENPDTYEDFKTIIDKAVAASR